MNPSLASIILILFLPQDSSVVLGKDFFKEQFAQFASATTRNIFVGLAAMITTHWGFGRSSYLPFRHDSLIPRSQLEI